MVLFKKNYYFCKRIVLIIKNYKYNDEDYSDYVGYYGACGAV